MPHTQTQTIPDYLIDPSTMTPQQLAAVLRDPRNADNRAQQAAHHLIAATDAVNSAVMRRCFRIRAVDGREDGRLLAVSVDFESLADREDPWSEYAQADGQMWAMQLALALVDGETKLDFTRTGEVPPDVARAAAEAMLILLGRDELFRVVSEPPF